MKTLCCQVILKRHLLDRDGTSCIPIGVIHNGVKRLIYPLPKHHSWDCSVKKKKVNIDSYDYCSDPKVRCSVLGNN